MIRSVRDRYRASIAEGTERRLQERLAALAALRSLSVDAAAYDPHVMPQLRRVAEGEQLYTFWMAILLIVTAPAWLVFWGAHFYYGRRVLEDLLPGRTPTSSGVLLFGAFLFLGVMAWNGFWTFFGFSRPQWAGTVLIWGSVFVLFWAGYTDSVSGLGPTANVMLGMLLPLYLVLLLLFPFIPALFLAWLFKERSRRLFSGAVIADELIDIIRLVETTPEPWFDTAFKRNLLNRIELAAGILEHRVSQSLPSAVDGSGQSSQEFFRRLASAVREMKFWIVIPVPDGRERILKRSAYFFHAAIGGEWGGVATLQLDMPRAASLRARLASVSRGLVVSAAPLLVAYVLQRTVPELDTTVMSSVRIFAWSWLGVGLLASLDPSATNRIGFVKEMPFFRAP